METVQELRSLQYQLEATANRGEMPHFSPLPDSPDSFLIPQGNGL